MCWAGIESRYGRRALEEYGKVWFGPALARDVAKGLRMLEANWKGRVLENKGIPKTLAHWEDIAKRVPDFDTNWRAQMYLFRARFDANVQAEARAQQGYEEQAYAALKKAKRIGAAAAIEEARRALAQADTPANPELRRSIEDLGPVLLRSIGYQLSIEPPYLARNSERGALLDWLDQPVNERPWLEQRFQSILALDGEADRLARLDEIIHWEDPGPGGFYDNLGALGEYKHVVYQRTWEEDPSGNHTARVAFPKYQADQKTIRESGSQAEAENMVFKEEVARLDGAFQGRQELHVVMESRITTLYSAPLKMRYEEGDRMPSTASESHLRRAFPPVHDADAQREFGIHGPVPQPDPIWPVSYYLPRAATKSGLWTWNGTLTGGRHHRRGGVAH